MQTQRTECEVKVEGSFDLATLLGLGGELLGQGLHKDVYLAGQDSLRIREENGNFRLTQKQDDVGAAARVKGVFSRILTPAEAQQLISERGVRVQVCKKRTLVALGPNIVCLDEVEHLGNFVEISGPD